MCSSATTSLELPFPIEKHSLIDEGLDEADKHKWILGVHRGCDPGEAAIREWVKLHWPTFLRAKWLEHLYGRTFWIELDQVDFGILQRRFQDSKLLRPILDRLLAGEENLNIYWSMDPGPHLEEVFEILLALHINSLRLENQLENRLAERRHRSRIGVGGVEQRG